MKILGNLEKREWKAVKKQDDEIVDYNSIFAQQTKDSITMIFKFELHEEILSKILVAKSLTYIFKELKRASCFTTRLFFSENFEKCHEMNNENLN